MTLPDGYRPLNYCRTCGLDFTSLDAFDRHLTGTPENRSHARPEDVALVLKGTVDGVDRYALPVSKKETARLAALSASRVSRVSRAAGRTRGPEIVSHGRTGAVA
jgi:hypothetical protein